MRPDSARYVSFYNSALGESVADLVGNSLANICPLHTQDIVCFFGFGLPYQAMAIDKACRFFHMMPAAQGAIESPEFPKSKIALVDDIHLPLPDCSVDVMVMVHALEHAPRPNKLLREIWRVLTPEGRIAIIVPNRTSSWAAFETTPFAYGRPWSRRQLNAFMQDHLFTPLESQSALMVPPLLMPAFSGLMPRIEKPMRLISKHMGGVITSVGRKQVFGGLTQRCLSKAQSANTKNAAVAKDR